MFNAKIKVRETRKGTLKWEEADKLQELFEYLTNPTVDKWTDANYAEAQELLKSLMDEKDADIPF